ncbi:MAG: hypothetical protein Q7J80_11950, partial [Anaerolineales bacterium]|nr:hypothetical protein [Anaerolineales bacterium]
MHSPRADMTHHQSAPRTLTIRLHPLTLAPHCVRCSAGVRSKSVDNLTQTCLIINQPSRSHNPFGSAEGSVSRSNPLTTSRGH